MSAVFLWEERMAGWRHKPQIFKCIRIYETSQKLRRNGERMNVTDYLSLEEEEKQKYDFSAENATEEYCKASGVEKYIIYKTYTSDSKWSKAFRSGEEFRRNVRKYYTEAEKNGKKVIKRIKDPDDFSKGSKSLLQEIYKKIWPDLECAYSDTMTSVQYIMARYFEEEKETGDEKKRRLKLSKRQLCSIKYMINLWSLEVKASDQEGIKNAVEKAAKNLSSGLKQNGLEDFLSAWHTLGNYCPVPKGFNVGRSNFGKHDFWDLTLMVIRKWYLTKDELLKEKIIREDLFHNSKKGDIGACTKWLVQCGGGSTGEECWENFVKKLAFEDWVDKDYAVKPLWEGHEWVNALLQVDDWERFFHEYSRRILERTKELIDRLSYAVRKEEIFHMDEGIPKFSDRVTSGISSRFPECD